MCAKRAQKREKSTSGDYCELIEKEKIDFLFLTKTDVTIES